MYTYPCSLLKKYGNIRGKMQSRAALGLGFFFPLGWSSWSQQEAMALEEAVADGGRRGW